MNSEEKRIIRELAKQYMEHAASEKQQRMYRRMQDNNDLKMVRPPVLVEEIPWYQMNIDDELTCLCEDERARALELYLRQSLYRWKHFQCDNLMEPFFRVHMAIDSTGNGLSRKEKILRTDEKNNIVAHEYEDVLPDEAALEKLHTPEFTLRPDIDEENVNFYTDLLGDSMPVHLGGPGCVCFPPWDRICELHGVENVMIDLYDRPEFMHKIMEKFCADQIAWLDFMEKHVPVDPTHMRLHATPAPISGLDGDGWKKTWFRCMAQPFSCVSPEMHEEFDVNYIKPIAERFAYTYYGCCEPLDRKLDVIKKISNLRKVGVSPWANEEVMGEGLGGNFVYARKPNPANVAEVTDPAVIRKGIEKTVQVCQKYGCPCEFVLKDISTVGHRPENLIVWAKTVSDVLDEYYDKA